MIGYSFFEASGTYWRLSQRVILPLTLPHVKQSMTHAEAQALLQDKGAWLIRWEENFDTHSSSPWWHVVRNQPLEYASLARKTRYSLRKAGALYTVKRCSRETILTEGYSVYSAAFTRYQTHEQKFSEIEFIDAVTALPYETEFWIVRKKESGRAVAFAETIVRDGGCFYVTLWLVPEDMRLFSGYLLFYEMTRYYLNERNLSYVTDGSRSLSHNTNVHEFLISKFGFRKAFANLNVVYAPWVKGIIVLIYPWRALVQKIPLDIFRKLNIVLQQEKIRRDCANNSEGGNGAGA